MELILKPKPRGLGGAYPSHSEVADYFIFLSEKDFSKSQCLRLAGAVGPLSPLQPTGCYPSVIPAPPPAQLNWSSPSQWCPTSEPSHFCPQCRLAMPPHPFISVTQGCAEGFCRVSPQPQVTRACCSPRAPPARCTGFEWLTRWPYGIPTDHCCALAAALVAASSCMLPSPHIPTAQVFYVPGAETMPTTACRTPPVVPSLPVCSWALPLPCVFSLS
jgi:hypothetical protein